MFEFEGVSPHRGSLPARMAETQISLPFTLAFLKRSEADQQRILDELSTIARDKLKTRLLELSGRPFDKDRLTGLAAKTLARMGIMTKRYAFYFVMDMNHADRKAAVSQMGSVSKQRLREFIFDLGVDYLRFHADYLAEDRGHLESRLHELLKPSYVSYPGMPGYDAIEFDDPLGELPREIMPGSFFPR